MNGMLTGGFLVILGVVLGMVPERLLARRRIKSHLLALRAAGDFSLEMAQLYLKPDRPFAPLYRLPLETFRSSFPTLLADGALPAESDVQIVLRFFNQVEQINRGLDLVDSAYRTALRDSYSAYAGTQLNEEIERLTHKAQTLSDLHSELIAVLEQRLASLKWLG